VSRKLERQLNELKEVVRRQGLLNSAPVYCREGQQPDGVDAERLVIIRRVYVDPPERGEETLPSWEAAEPEKSKPKPKGVDGSINYQPVGANHRPIP
jgi:hypothetical protein